MVQTHLLRTYVVRPGRVHGLSTMYGHGPRQPSPEHLSRCAPANKLLTSPLRPRLFSLGGGSIICHAGNHRDLPGALPLRTLGGLPPSCKQIANHLGAIPTSMVLARRESRPAERPWMVVVYDNNPGRRKYHPTQVTAHQRPKLHAYALRVRVPSRVESQRCSR